MYVFITQISFLDQSIQYVNIFSSLWHINYTTHQCFFSRNIGWVAPKIIYFQYLKKYFLDQSIQKIVYLILKIEALPPTASRWSLSPSANQPARYS